MKYTGSITVADDEGNVVFERELDEDEIVEAILAAVPDSDEADDPEQSSEEAPLGERPARAKRECGKCGQTGHNAKTCGRSKEEDDNAWRARKAAEERKKVEDGIATLVAAGCSYEEIADKYRAIEQPELEELIASAERALD